MHHQCVLDRQVHLSSSSLDQLLVVRRNGHLQALSSSIDAENSIDEIRSIANRMIQPLSPVYIFPDN